MGEERTQYRIDLYNTIKESDGIIDSKPELKEKKSSGSSIEEIKNIILENWLVVALLIIIFILAIIGIILAINTYKHSKELREVTGEDNDIIDRDEEKTEKIYDDIIREREKKTGKHF